ncbi:MAG: tail fiber domain-containing protein [Bacteroidota bacterium]
MNILTKHLLVLFLLNSTFLTMQAQVGINENNSEPDASAMLDISSSDKGILIPRMTSEQRMMINSPATGLMVFDMDTNSFWYFSTAWSEIGGAFSSKAGVTFSTKNDDDFVVGADSLNHKMGEETKMLFDKEKGAFRVGRIDNSRWDDDNIGYYSFANGWNTLASGRYATAWGEETSAISLQATAWGIETTASGGASTAWGKETISSSLYTTAWGRSTAATELFATAWGLGSQASGVLSTALGEYTFARSTGEVAIGMYNTDYTPISINNYNENDRLFVIGNGQGNITVNGQQTFNRSDALIVYKNGNMDLNGALKINNAFTLPTVDGTVGQVLTTNGNGGVNWSNNTGAFISKNGITAAVNKDDNFVVGAESLNHGGGDETKMFFDNLRGAFRAGQIFGKNWDADSLGTLSFGWGYNTKAKGSHATAFGATTTASDYTSTAFGIGSIASGYNATAFGWHSIASNVSTTAFGREAEASGYNATAIGSYVTAPSFAEVAIGTHNTAYTPNDNFNFDTNDRLFVVGNGTGPINRSDALIVYKNGNMDLNGALKVNNAFTLPTVDGTVGQVLTTDGNGNISWSDEITGAFSSQNGLTTSLNNEDDFVFGADSLNITSDIESKLFFHKEKSAFRVGQIQNENWDIDSLGFHSFSSGFNTKAKGLTSTALGFSTSAEGDNSTALGYRTRTSGDFSTALGVENEAYSFGEMVIGSYSTHYTPRATKGFHPNDRLFVIGNSNNSTYRSDAVRIYKNGNMELNGALTIDSSYTFPVVDGNMGQVLTTDGNGHVSWSADSGVFNSQNGVTTSLNNEDDFIFGADSLNHGVGSEVKLFLSKEKGAFRVGTISDTDWDIENLGNGSFASGLGTKASGFATTAMGIDSEARGDFSTAIGSENVATGIHALAMGTDNVASGDYATAFGIENTASGSISTAFGWENQASGNYATAFGGQNTATGIAATAFGGDNDATATAATAFGNLTRASGLVSTSFGFGNHALSFGETAIGTFCTIDTPNSATTFDANDRIFVIGNGEVRNRSDAFTVYKNGNAELNGALTLNNAYTLPTSDGTNAQVLATDGNGNTYWRNGVGDNLGNHTTTQNLQLADNWLSNDGGDEGIAIDTDGRVNTSSNLGVGGTLSAQNSLTLFNGNQNVVLFADNANRRVVLDVGGSGASSDAFIIGDLTNGTNEVLMLGNVGIGTFITPQKLTVGARGDGTKAVANGWEKWSDKRLKRDFEQLNNPIQKLKAINGYYYYWKEDKTDQTRQVGVIAQEIETVLPEIVTTNPDGYKSLDYGKLTALLIEVNQAQQEEIEALKAQVAKIGQIEKVLNQLQAKIHSDSNSLNNSTKE